MSWIEKLQKTYDNCYKEIGCEQYDQKGNLKSVLLPICHTSQYAQIEIVLDGDGCFLRASVVPKNGTWQTVKQTILPATEGAAGRTSSKVAPLALGDKLQYIAGDYKKYKGTKPPGYEKYIARLGRWAKSEYGTHEIKAVLLYLEKRNTIQDLIKAEVLFYDAETESFPSKWSGENKDKKEIFSVIQDEQLDSLIRFSVEIPGQKESHLWKNSKLWNSWKEYYLENKILEDNFDIKNTKDYLPDEKTVFCYVAGKELNFAKNHPAKIRNAHDGAKLISSNDNSGFTYRGRFLDSGQACTVSYEVSQKAHNALRWLIAKQGYSDGKLAIVAWSPNDIEIPNPCEDSYSGYGMENMVDEDITDTSEYTGKALTKRIAGYATKMGPTDEVVVMGINSITKGRISISFYRELTGSEFLVKLENWHTGCAWKQDYSKNKIFYGAPSPGDIAWAAFGTKLGTTGNVDSDDKIKRQTIERLLPCIIDGMNIPIDIVRSLVRSASKRIVYSYLEWKKILGIACAVFRYSEKGKEYKMALEKERTSRDYLFGRLLAVADCMEGFALSQSDQKRPTNATRLMQRFSEHPYSTWRTIELALIPYKASLGYKGRKYEKALGEIMNNFISDDFCRDTALSGEFLLGFHTQRAELMKGNEKKDENKGEE